MSFKIGDTVRIRNHAKKQRDGRTRSIKKIGPKYFEGVFKIKKINNSSFRDSLYILDFDFKFDYGFFEDELTLVPKNCTLIETKRLL